MRRGLCVTRAIAWEYLVLVNRIGARSTIDRVSCCSLMETTSVPGRPLCPARALVFFPSHGWTRLFPKPN